MDTQFSKWSYDLNEGTTAIPFVMAKAPAETHERLVATDRKLWITNSDDNDGDGGLKDSQRIANALLERAQDIKDSNEEKSTRVAKTSTSYMTDVLSKGDSTSKRAALIAKSKAAQNNSIVVSKSINQRRSALHKNKSRISAMPSVPPIPKKQELAPKPQPQPQPQSQAERSKPTILIFNNNKLKDQRREADSALQTRTIDVESKADVEALMERLCKTNSAADEEQLDKEVDVRLVYT